MCSKLFNKIMSIKKNNLTIIILLACLLLFSILYIVINLENIILAQAGDPYATLYNLWRYKEGLSQPTYLFPEHSLFKFYSIIINWLTNEVSTYNFLFIVYMFFSALPFYLIVKKITRSNILGLMAGFLIILMPYRFVRSFQHLNLANIGFLGFLIYFLILSREKNSWKNTSLVALFFVLTVLDSYIYGLFAGIILIMYLVIILVEYLKNKDKKMVVAGWTRSIVPFLIGLLVIGYFISPFIKDVLKKGNDDNLTAARTRELGELTTYSSYLGYYFIPPADNPFLGKLAGDYYDDKVDELGTNTTEQINYLGYILMVLSAIYLIYFIKNYKAFDHITKFSVWFLVLIGAVGFYLSFSYPIYWFGIRINPLPDKFFSLAPFFRVYARFALLPFMSLAVLASLGVKIILDKISNKNIKNMVFVGLIILICAEALYLPKDAIQRVDWQAMPQVYKNIDCQKKDCAIAEYPFLPRESPNGYEYVLWRRLHGMRLLNSYRDFEIDQSVFDMVSDPNTNECYDLLKERGVEYIIIHTKKYSEYTRTHPKEYNMGIVPEIDENKFIFVGKFGDDLLYRLK